MSCEDLNRNIERLYDRNAKHGGYLPLPLGAPNSQLTGHLNPKWRSPIPRLNLLLQELSVLRSGTVVELGCNTGFTLLELAKAFPQIRFIGFEPNANHAQLVSLLIKHLNLGNCEVVDRGSSPAEILEDFRDAHLLDFNVAHHAGGDFEFGSVTSPDDWWSSFINRWLAPMEHFRSYWFSCGFRWRGSKGDELHPPEDPAGFAERIEAAFPRNPNSEIRIFGVEPSLEPLAYKSVLRDGRSVLNDWTQEASVSGAYVGEYFRRPIFSYRVGS